MDIPEHYRYERYYDLVIAWVEGKANRIEEALRAYSIFGELKGLDFSPLMEFREGRAHKLSIANQYAPDVFTFQIAQYTRPEEDRHTVLVCTGIGKSTL